MSIKSFLQRFKPQPFVNTDLNRPGTPPLYDRLKESCDQHYMNQKAKDPRLAEIEQCKDSIVNYEAKEIICKLKDGSQVKADVIPAGKYDKKKKTWKWLWIDDYGNIDFHSPLMKIKNQGLFNPEKKIHLTGNSFRIELMSKVEWYASMEDARSMIQIANKVLDGKGFIILEEEQAFYYLVIKELEEV